MKDLELAQALVNRDDKKECPFCSKVDWGAVLHDEDCPFAMAYKIIYNAEQS